MLFLKKKAPARNAPVVVRARSSENRRMFLPNIEETPRSTLWKQILMKWVYHKGKTESRFYHENFDPTGKYHCKSVLYQKYRIESFFVRSFWAWRFCKNLEEKSGFKQKTWQYETPRNQGFQGFGSKHRSNPKDDKTKNDAMVGVYPLECPKPIIWLEIYGKLRKPTSEKAWTSQKKVF